MDPITPEQIEKRRADLQADLQRTQQQINLYTQKSLMLQGVLLEIEGWTKGELASRYAEPAPTPPKRRHRRKDTPPPEAA